MIIAIGFVFPCLLYLALYLLFSRNILPTPRLGLASLILASVIALISSVTLLFVLRFSTNWSGRTQVEWTGVEVIGQPLVIGGAREQALVGWPNESFAPVLKVTALDEHTGAVEISSGEAFLYDEKKNQFLNGEVIRVGRSKIVGEFTIKVSGSYYLWQQVDVADSKNEVWASFDLPAAMIKRDRVYSLAERVNGYSVEKIRQNPAQLVKLEEWADDMRLLLTRDGEIRLLGKESQHGQCEFPCKLSLFWVNRRLQFELNRDGAKLSLCYPPPRQLVSPLPPPSGSNGQQLVITGETQPGDIAFSLPLGHGVQDPRRTITFANNSSGTTVISTPGAVTGENRQQPYLPERLQPETVAPCAESGVTSRMGVQSGNAIFNFATVTDLPNLWLLVLLLFLALICFASGLLLVFPRMPDHRTRWVLYGLASVLWNLLAFRLLLALRYAISLSNLDFLVVKGVITALVGLAVVPGLVLLTARFKRDLFERPETERGRILALVSALAYAVLLLIVGWVEYFKAPTLWVNLPLRFNPAANSQLTNYILATLMVVGFLYLLLVSFALYRTALGASPTRRKAVKIVLWPLNSPLEAIARRGKRIWSSAGAEQPWPRPKQIAFLIVIAVISAAFFLLPRLIALVSSGVSKIVSVDTFVHDVVAPLCFFWPLAVLWLAAKLTFPPGTRLPPLGRFYKNPSLRRRLSRVILFAFATITVPVFILPVGINDVGSILGGLAIMLATAAVLFASPPRRWAGVALLALLTGLGGATYYYANIGSISPYLPEGMQIASSRLLVFKEGNGIQRLMPFTSVFGGQLQKLRDGYQHTWENQAIAHEGALLGLGFGNAPTQRSQVRQDTIQYDSVFSFFIVSEHGLIGGILLLLLFAMPLLIILIGGRSRFDFGYAVACVIASSMLLEALFHAAMNLNLLPFTGRDLPLLTVNSFTDLLRWTILFSFIVQAVLARYRGRSDFREDAVSVITPAPQEKTAPKFEPWRHYIWLVVLALLVPLLLFTGILWAGIGVWQDKDKQFGTPFSWNGILEVVDRMARDNLIVVKPDQTLEINRSLKISPGMLIDQEIARFNALPLEERVGQSALSNYQERLKQINSRAEYEQILDGIRKQSLSERRHRRVSLFKLLPPLRWNDGTRIREEGGYRVVPNREFNTQVSFKVGVTDADLPRTTFRDGQGMLIGPAWVRGKWAQTFDPEPALPWIEHLKGVLEAEWERLGRSDAVKSYGTLSLDRKLQEAASTFVATKGWELHDQLLKSRDGATTLPPRVALSVINIPSGEVLALGGWPRVTSGRFWIKSRDRREWLPPAGWVEHEAPEYLRGLYEGDRNFDRMVMGSSTKPLWAAAVLSVHPNLDERLMTRGSEQTESDVFGIRLSLDWEVHANRNWVDFKNYLAHSDNRYQVRLGFLGLAETFGGDVTDEGASNSERESLGGRPPHPWRKFPKFPPEINFSRVQPGPFRRLNETPLAKGLQNMFGFGVTENYFGHRRSFWTKSEADDLSQALVDRGWLAVFNAISPQAVDLSLNRIRNPRDYVTLLLGGGTNLWANPDFAAAFATCVTGQPLIAHVVKNQNQLTTLPDRKPFPEIAAKIRPALIAVLTDGTGRVTELTSALSALHKPAGTKIYAKTGTLSDRNDALNTSRIVLAIIRWDDEKKGKVKAGLVFSLVVERGGMTTSSRWLGQFIANYHSDIERLLGQ
jgi:cell division protein FtsW (lipid II flippase)